jgi:surface carbohydrate biosynthesis protein
MSPTENVAVYHTEKILVNKYSIDHLVDGVLLAGDALKNIYLKTNKISEKKIYVVGFPTFDWCVPTLNSYFVNKDMFLKQYGIPKNKKLILLATSFAEADLNIHNYSKEYFNTTMPKQTFLNYHKASKSMRTIIINFFPLFLKKHPEWHLLVKKHPAEKKALYLSSWINHPQITHVHDEDIHTLLAHCDVLIHRNSTTSIQAWGFNKPTILLNLKEINTVFGETTALTNFQKGNYICDDLKKLDAILTSIFHYHPLPGSQIISRNNYITKWFYKMDGKSSKRTADIIYQLFMKNKQRKIAYRTHPIDILHFIFGILQMLIYKIKLYTAWIFYNIHHYPQSIIRILGKHYDNFFLEFYILKLEKKIKHHILYEKTT